MRTYRRARKRALERDRACVVCGTEQDLTAHHKVPRFISRDNSASNLTILCRACHSAVEELDAIPLYLSWAAYILKRGIS
jgi:5-methylcytosine-specific restriction endonuclease McrA